MDAEHEEPELTLKDLFTELRQQQVEVRALREEVKGTTESVTSEVRKLKSSKEIKWKFEGNRIQHEFNSSADTVA